MHARARNEEIHGSLSMIVWTWGYECRYCMFELKLLLLSTFLHVQNEAFLCISRLRSLNESCSARSLENYGTNHTLIAILKREIWSFCWNWSKLSRFYCTPKMNMNLTPNEKYASNKTCKRLNELSMDTKSTQFGLKMKKLWPLEVD